MEYLHDERFGAHINGLIIIARHALLETYWMHDLLWKYQFWIKNVNVCVEAEC